MREIARRETPREMRRARSSERAASGEVSAPRIPALIKFHSNFSNYLTHPATRAVRPPVTRFSRYDDAMG